MKWIGLTGGLGTGKSTVAEILRQKGYVVIDADEMARLAVAPGSQTLTKVLDHFGVDLVGADGKLDRKKLGSIVFADTRRLLELEALVHPAVKKLTLENRTKAEDSGHQVAFYDVPLLFEKNMEKDFTAIVVVTATRENQIDRATARDALGREEVLRRLANQLPVEEKVKRGGFVIENNGSRAELQKKVEQVLGELLKA